MHKKGNESEPQANPKPNFRSRVTAGLDLLPSIHGLKLIGHASCVTPIMPCSPMLVVRTMSRNEETLARRIACLQSELSIRRRFTIASPVAFPFARAMPVFLRRAGELRRTAFPPEVRRVVSDVWGAAVDYRVNLAGGLFGFKGEAYNGVGQPSRPTPAASSNHSML